jgi:hypothetical protein
VVPGNHDHGLLRGWLERRDPSVALGLESAVDWDPREGLGELAGQLAPAAVRVAYPGVWLREDVYAIHGHYGDRHNTVPIVERVLAGLNVRLTGEPPGGPARAEDYEAALAPMYAWIDTVAQMGGLRGSGSDGSFQVKAWRALGGSGGRRGLRGRAMAAGFPLAVGGLNLAGLGPLRADVSAVELRRAALRAFSEVSDRLRVPATHVIFGHTHRAGPLPGDEWGEWEPAHPPAHPPGHPPGHRRLLNTGSWVYEPGYLGDSPGDSPYRPGFAAIVDDDDPLTPPELVNLLDGDA